jgi:hypothetical protein
LEKKANQATSMFQPKTHVVIFLPVRFTVLSERDEVRRKLRLKARVQPQTLNPQTSKENTMLQTANNQPATNQPRSSWTQLGQRLSQTHRPLFISGILTVVMGLFFIAGIFLDSRYITGAPAWVKPTKFAISVVVYTFTLLWMMSFIQGRKRLVSMLGWLVLTTFAVEWVAIITQALRGTTSHFNVQGSVNAALWSAMAIAIMILFITNMVVAVSLLRQRFANPVFAWGLRLGLIITIIGLGEGYLMTSPTALQLTGWNKGEAVTIVGAHSVGIEDGGPGLPGLNWSTVGGDLRIGHFVGMHALQVLPFVAWFVSRRRRLSTRQQLQLVWTAGLGYLGIVALVTWQALRAQPIIAPDSLTVAVFSAIILSVLIATVVVTRSRLTRA